MNKSIIGVVSFIFGAAVSSFITRELVKKKYERIAQEEIESVKELYKTRESVRDIQQGIIDGWNNPNKVLKEKIQSICDKAMNDYKKILKDQKYSNDTKNDNSERSSSMKPYVISPDEFGEMEDEDYDKVSFTYYADGVLADEYDEIVENVDEIVGEESLTHFGEYEDDSVFVRNDKLKCDYEILLDQRNYSDI